MMLKKKTEYLALVALIKKTTKIESVLSELGGTGGSIWKKAQSLKQINSNDFMSKVILIIVIRNNALHGELDNQKIFQAIKVCDELLSILEQNKKLNSLTIELEKKLEKYNYDNKIELSKSIKRVHSNNKEYLDSLIVNEKRRLEEVNTYIKTYLITHRLKPIGIGIVLLFILLFVWQKV